MFVTKVEVAKDGSKTIYHRNGRADPRFGEVTRAWDHPANRPEMRDFPNVLPCPACNPEETSS